MWIKCTEQFFLQQTNRIFYHMVSNCCFWRISSGYMMITFINLHCLRTRSCSVIPLIYTVCFGYFNLHSLFVYLKYGFLGLWEFFSVHFNVCFRFVVHTLWKLLSWHLWLLFFVPHGVCFSCLLKFVLRACFLVITLNVCFGWIWWLLCV